MIFLSQTTLLRQLTFLLGSLTVLSYSPAFLIFFLSSDPSICSEMAFSVLGNSGHLYVSIFIDFPIDTKGGAPFHCAAFDYTQVDWDGLYDNLRDVPQYDFFKCSASAAGKLCYWVLVRLDLYIPHRKYQSSLIHLHGFQLFLVLP